MRQSYYKEKFICSNELVNDLVKEVYKGSRSKYKVGIYLMYLLLYMYQNHTSPKQDAAKSIIKKTYDPITMIRRFFVE